MNKRGGLVLSIVFLAAVFLVGFVIGWQITGGEDKGEIERLENVNVGLTSQVSDLEVQVADLTSQIDSQPENYLTAYCQRLKDEHDAYIDSFRVAGTCNVDNECKRVTEEQTILSCDVCISALAETTRITELREEFERRKCVEFFDFDTTCTSALFPCRCSDEGQCVLAF